MPFSPLCTPPSQLSPLVAQTHTQTLGYTSSRIQVLRHKGPPFLEGTDLWLQVATGPALPFSAISLRKVKGTIYLTQWLWICLLGFNLFTDFTCILTRNKHQIYTSDVTMKYLFYLLVKINGLVDTDPSQSTTKCLVCCFF